MTVQVGDEGAGRVEPTEEKGCFQTESLQWEPTGLLADWLWCERR